MAVRRTIILIVLLVLLALGPGALGQDSRQTLPESDPVDELVRRWLAGESLEAEVYSLSRKAIGALEEHRDDPRAAQLLARIEARPIRILFVDSFPRWETRFLSSALLRDPGLLVHTLLLESDPAFPHPYTVSSDDPDFQRGLDGFPSKLASRYDVILLGDIPSESIPALQVQRFVRDQGGGLLHISGERNSPFQRTAGDLAPLLPALPGPFQNAAAGLPVRARQLEGEPNPILERWRELSGEDGTSYEWVERLPSLTAFSVATTLQEGARVLLETVPAPGLLHSYPILVEGMCGHGRVIWSATDEFWRWREGTGDQPYYYPLYRAAIESLAKREG